MKRESHKIIIELFYVMLNRAKAGKLRVLAWVIPFTALIPWCINLDTSTKEILIMCHPIIVLLICMIYLLAMPFPFNKDIEKCFFVPRCAKSIKKALSFITIVDVLVPTGLSLISLNVYLFYEPRMVPGMFARLIIWQFSFLFFVTNVALITRICFHLPKALVVFFCVLLSYLALMNMWLFSDNFIMSYLYTENQKKIFVLMLDIITIVCWLFSRKMLNSVIATVRQVTQKKSD